MHHRRIFSIGRARECDVVLADPSVSRRHAQIEFADGGMELFDCNSTGGTYLLDNGGRRRVTRTRLPVNAMVQFGDVEIASGDLIAVVSAIEPGLETPPAAEPVGVAPEPVQLEPKGTSPTTRLVRCDCGQIIRFGTLCPECNR